MRKFLDSQFFYVVISFFFAVLLFFNANSILLRNNNPNATQFGTSEVYNVTLESVPVTLKYNSDKYYVYGYEETVSVYLTSYNKLRLDTEKNEATRSFSVIADLTKKTPGTYEIPLSTVGLSQSVTSEVNPKKITVTIEEKGEKDFEVTPIYKKNQLIDGYTVQEATTSPQKISITTGKTEMNSIARIEAVLPKNVELDHDYTGVVPIRAVDKNGQAVSVTAVPSEVQLSVKVLAPMKTVTVVPTQTGTIPSDVLQYNFTLNTHTVEISGPLEEISKVDAIHLPIKIDGIEDKITKDIPFTQENYSVKPGSVKVTIEPVKKKENSQTSKTNEHKTKNEGEK